MTRARYIPGALVEARHNERGKGYGMIIQGPTRSTKVAHGLNREELETPQEWFLVSWFERPALNQYDMSAAIRGEGVPGVTVRVTKNQIKLVRPR
tara:strand:+ start:176 stop:460 length:285 start_codon:yes stop_codon:yes gene_type:complete